MLPKYFLEYDYMNVDFNGRQIKRDATLFICFELEQL